MSPMLRTILGLALAGLLCLAPIGMAAGTAPEKSPGAATEKTPAAPGPQAQPPKTSVPGVTAGDRITATVEGVDQSKGTLKLRAADGDRLEFKAPKGMLASLQAGDQVQIAIQKAPGTPERSPTSGAERLRPEQPK